VQAAYVHMRAVRKSPHVFDDQLLSKCFGKASCQGLAVSEELPAAKGTTIVTGRIGQLCAAAIPSMAMAASAQSARRAG
jgi:hypothetical protein